MKDSGIMKVYYLDKKAYEISMGASYDLAKEIIYAPNLGILAPNPQNSGEYFYFREKNMMNDAESIIKQMKIKPTSVDTDEFFEVLRVIKEREKISREANKKAKSLFELVMKGRGAGGGCCGTGTP